MRILIFLSIVALGKTSEDFPIAGTCCKALNRDLTSSLSSYSVKPEYSAHVPPNLDSKLPSSSFGNPVSPAIQGSFKSYVPSFKQGITYTQSPIAPTGFLSTGPSSFGQQHHVQPLSSEAGIGSPDVSASFAHSPAVSAQKLFSLNFAGQQSDTVLASRFLPVIDQNENYSSKPKLLANYDKTDYVTTTSKPLVNIPSSSVTIITPPTPTTVAPTPYIPVTTPVPTTAFPKANFGTVTQSFYPSTTFKPYSSSIYSDYNSIFSTPRPFNTYSKVYTTPAPATTPFSSTYYPRRNSKTVTQYPTASMTFKPFSTPQSNNYNSIYSTPVPFNSYSRVYSTAYPVTTPSSTTDSPKAIFKTSYPSTTFKPYSTPLYNNYNSIYSTSAPLNSYSKIFSTPVPLTSNIIKSSSVSNGASQAVNNLYSSTHNFVPSTFNSAHVTTQSKPIVTSFSPYSSKQTSSLFSKPYSADKLSSSYSGIFSTPATVITTPSPVPVFKSTTPNAYSTPYSATLTTPIPSIAPQVNFKTVTAAPYSSTTFKSSLSSASLPYSYNSFYSTPKPLSSYSNPTPIPVVSNVTNSGVLSSKYATDILSETYSTNTKSSLLSNRFSSPSTPSSSFPILTSPAPISPTPYSATVKTPSLSTAFFKDDFKSVTPASYSSSTFKPYTTADSLAYSYSSGFTTPSPIVPNAFKFSTTANAGKSKDATASQILKPKADLTSRFDTVHTPLSDASVSTGNQQIKSFSLNYPKSNIGYGSSLGFNSKPVTSQTLFSGDSFAHLPFRNINSGVFDVPSANQHTYYSGNLSPTYKVSENTLYSPPAPISYSSLSSNPDLFSSSVYSSTLGSNARLSSIHSPGDFGITVQQAPLTKEFHTVEEPVVNTWKSIDSWNTAPVSHFRPLFH